MNHSMLSQDNKYNMEDKTLAVDRFGGNRASENLFTTNAGRDGYDRDVVEVGKTRGKRNSNPQSRRDEFGEMDSDSSRRDRGGFNATGGRESSKDIEEQLTKLKKTFATLCRDK